MLRGRIGQGVAINIEEAIARHLEAERLASTIELVGEGVDHSWRVVLVGEVDGQVEGIIERTSDLVGRGDLD